MSLDEQNNANAAAELAALKTKFETWQKKAKTAVAKQREMYDLLSKRFPDTPEFYERLAYLSTLAEQPKDALKALDKLEKITDRKFFYGDSLEISKKLLGKVFKRTVDNTNLYFKIVEV